MENKIKQLSKYQTFFTKSQLIDNVDSFVKSNHITKSALKVLRLIAWQAKNHLGACWLKVSTICKKCDISDATVRRATRQLEKRGIIKKISTTRELSGGDGANIYQILPFYSSDSGNDSPQLTDRFDDETVESPSDSTQDFEPKYVSSEDVTNKKNKDKESRKEDQPADIKFDHTFVSDHVPGEFIQGIKKYFDDADTIEQIWDRVTKAANMYGPDVLLEEVVVEAINAVKISIRKLKQRKIKAGNKFDSFLGYLFGVVSSKLAVQQRKVIVFDHDFYE